MRILALVLIAGGISLLIAAAVAYQHDRDQLATWDRVSATVDSVSVGSIEPSGLNRGRWVAQLYITYEHHGQTLRAKIWEPVWARRTRAKAREDADAAKAAGKEMLLVDPVDSRHISGRPDDWVYYYRDAWQRALLGTVLLILGVVFYKRRA